jgi:hypothetical protein
MVLLTFVVTKVRPAAGSIYASLSHVRILQTKNNLSLWEHDGCLKIAINGYGRIGRNVLRAWVERGCPLKH